MHDGVFPMTVQLASGGWGAAGSPSGQVALRSRGPLLLEKNHKLKVPSGQHWICMRVVSLDSKTTAK